MKRLFIRSKDGEERPRCQQTEKDDQNAVQKGQSHTNRGGLVGFLRFLFTKSSGDDRIDTDAHTHGKRQDNILERVNERDRSKRLRSQPGHKDTVYNVVKRISMDSTIGAAMDNKSGKTGFVFIKSCLFCIK